MVGGETIFFSHFHQASILSKNLQKPPKRGVTLEFEWKMILTRVPRGQVFQKPPFDPRADAFKFHFILAFSAQLTPCHKLIFKKICYQSEILMHSSKHFSKVAKTENPWWYWWILTKKSGCSLINSILESKKEHAYHFSTHSVKNAHDNRFGIKNSHFFLGIIHGNKMSNIPLIIRCDKIVSITPYFLPSQKNANPW